MTERKVQGRQNSRGSAARSAKVKAHGGAGAGTNSRGSAAAKVRKPQTPAKKKPSVTNIARPQGPKKLEIRNGMIVVRSVNLETVCGITSGLPHHTWPEFAFAGKSNVGKSTLINGLMQRKSYARTSSTPGKTQTINFYNMNDQFYLVDLPGYGYAKARLEDKEQWGVMIENYLHNSPTLKTVFLLVDSRHEAGDNDAEMYDWILQAGFTPVVIATKTDKIKPAQLPEQLGLVRQSLLAKSRVRLSGDADLRLIAWSGETKAGLREIYGIIEDLFDKN